MRTIRRNPIIGTGYVTLSKVKENDGISLELSNDSHTVPYTEDGSWGNYTGCETIATLFVGNREENSNVRFNVKFPSNVKGTWNSKTRTLKVNEITTDTAYVDIEAFYTDKISQIETKHTRSFTINKVRNGKDTILVDMSNDYHVFRCNADGEIENENGVTIYTTVSAFIGVEPVDPKNIAIRLRPLHEENQRDLSVELNGSNNLRITAKKGVGLPQNGSYTFDVDVTKIDELSKEAKVATIPKTFAWNKINDGLPAVIAALTNDSHTLPSDKYGENVIYDGCYTKIELFRGGKLVKNGITYSFYPQSGIVQGTGDYNTGVYTVTNLKGLSGWVDLVATYEGESFTCRFTITKARQGIEGYTINMSNDTHVFPCQANGYILEPLVTETEIMVHLGLDAVPIYLGTLPNNIPGLRVEEIPTELNDHIVKLRITAAQGTDLAMNGDFDIPIKSVDGALDTTKKFSWAKTKQGESSEYNYSQLVSGFDLYTTLGGSKWNENKKGWNNRDKSNAIKGFSITTLGTKNSIQKSDKIMVQFSLNAPTEVSSGAYFKIDFYRDLLGEDNTGKHTLSKSFSVASGTNVYNLTLDCEDESAIAIAKSIYMELYVGTNECTLYDIVIKKMITPNMIPDQSINKDHINTTGLIVPFVSNKVVKIDESVGVEIKDGKLTVKDNAGSTMISGNGSSGQVTIKILNCTTLTVGGNTVYHTGNLPTASTSQAGVVQLSSSTSSTSTSLAATASAVKAAYDLANSKANSSHGNHVPATTSANNLKFLRCDNSWATIQSASTSQSGVVQLSSSTSSTSTTLAATASAVKAAYDKGNHPHPYVPTSASCNKNWNWSWGNTPTHLWGAEDYSGNNFYVYSPSDLRVGYASDAGYASNSGKLNGRTWFYGGTTPSGAKPGDIWLYF